MPNLGAGTQQFASDEAYGMADTGGAEWKSSLLD